MTEKAEGKDENIESEMRQLTKNIFNLEDAMKELKSFKNTNERGTESDTSDGVHNARSLPGRRLSKRGWALLSIPGRMLLSQSCRS